MKDFRKSLLIDPKLQGRMILGANLLAFVTIAVLFVALRFFEGKIRMKAAGLGLDPGHPFLAYLDQRERSLFALGSVASLFVFALFNAAGLLFSHRIAGPLYRLRKHLEAVAQGDSDGDVRFRDGDFFQDIAQVVNRVMARLRRAESGATSSSERSETRAPGA